jgi:hypothetical protein
MLMFDELNLYNSAVAYEFDPSEPKRNLSRHQFNHIRFSDSNSKFFGWNTTPLPQHIYAQKKVRNPLKSKLGVKQNRDGNH